MLKRSLYLLSLFILLVAIPAWADNAIRIEADKVIYNKKTETYIASGNCVIQNETYTIKSDNATFNRNNYLATLTGNILIEDSDGDWIRASSAQINLSTYRGLIKNATMFIKSNGFYIKAKTIRMLSKMRFQVEDALLTSCNCPLCLDKQGYPDWSITAKHTRIVRNRYIIAYPVVFRVKRMPVIFAPVVERNLSKKRKTGFLSPAIGYSTLKGTKYEQPFFINISPSQDITLSPFIYTKKGYGITALYRFYWTKDSKGNWHITVFDEKKGYNGERKRIRVYIKAWQYANFTSRLSSYYSLNLVNNRNNLRVLNKDSISLASDRYTKSTAGITYTAPGYSFGIYGYYYQDLVAENNKETLQKLPQIQFNLTNRKLYKNLTLDLSETATNNFRIEGARGYSNDLTAFLSYPFKLDAFSIVPSIGAHQLYAYWKIAPQKEHYSRRSFIPNYNIAIKTSLFRVFNLEKRSGIVALKHILTPSISYHYIPERDQTKFPDFVNEYSKTNIIQLSLENRLLAKEKNKNSISYREMLYLKIAQSYDFTKSSGGPFPPLYEELRFSPFGWLNLDSKSHFSTRLGMFTDSDNSIGINLGSVGTSVSYLMMRDSSNHSRVDENIKYKLFFYPSKSLYTYIEAERNVLDHYFTKKRIGFMYNSNCWGIGIDVYENQIPIENSDGTYTRKKDTGFWITLSLKGLLTIKRAY